MNSDDTLLETTYFKLYLNAGLNDYRWSDKLSKEKQHEIISEVFLDFALAFYHTTADTMPSKEQFLLDKLAEIRKYRNSLN